MNAQRSSTMECYSATQKKNETMLFATTWMDLEITTVSEASQTKILLTCGI